MPPKRFHAVRHGQAIHNVHKGWPERDPPLTEQGLTEAREVLLPSIPDLIICSPMTRTIQTSYAILSNSMIMCQDIPIEIWPDLRETHDHAICNRGLSKAELEAAYPTLDFSRCHKEWDYPEHTDERASQRAEGILNELKRRPETNVLLVTHRGILAYLVGGEIFTNCELRSYEFDNQGRVMPVRLI